MKRILIALALLATKATAGELVYTSTFPLPIISEQAKQTLMVWNLRLGRNDTYAGATSTMLEPTTARTVIKSPNVSWWNSQEDNGRKYGLNHPLMVTYKHATAEQYYIYTNPAMQTWRDDALMHEWGHVLGIPKEHLPGTTDLMIAGLPEQPTWYPVTTRDALEVSRIRGEPTGDLSSAVALRDWTLYIPCLETPSGEHIQVLLAYQGEYIWSLSKWDLNPDWQETGSTDKVVGSTAYVESVYTMDGKRYRITLKHAGGALWRLATAVQL